MRFDFYFSTFLLIQSSFADANLKEDGSEDKIAKRENGRTRTKLDDSTTDSVDTRLVSFDKKQLQDSFLRPVFKTRPEERSFFEPSDFVFDLKGSTPSQGAGGTIQAGGLSEFPALQGEGVAFTLFNIEPCGINLPHVHPRATELLYVIKGSNLRTAFVEENGGRTIVNDINAGEVTVFPEGLIHYQQNLGCEPAEYISGLNSEDPGVVTISSQLFTLPDEALTATFGQYDNVIKSLRAGLPQGPAEGAYACRQKCGIKQRLRGAVLGRKVKWDPKNRI